MAAFDQLSPAESGLFVGFDDATISRGAAYARQGRVALESWDPALMSATGTCVGSSGDLYYLEVGIVDDTRQCVVDFTECDCPVGEACKHAVALALGVMRAGLLGASPRGVRHASAPWRALLGDLVADATPKEPGSAPIGLLVELDDPEWMSLKTVTLRLVTPGKKGNWVRTGITWSSIEPGHVTEYYRSTTDHPAEHFDPVHLARVRAVHLCAGDKHLYGTSQVHRLDQASAEIWTALRAAVDDGVVLVAHKSTGAKKVELLPPATAALAVDRDDEGLAVSGGVDFPTVGPSADDALMLFGSVPHGASLVRGGTMFLAPLVDDGTSKALRALLDAGTIRIRDADIAEFADEVLPDLAGRMSVTVADGAVTRPEITGPNAAVTLRVADDGGAHLEWGVVYHVNGSRRFFPSGQSSGFGDDVAERRLWKQLRGHLEAAARVCDRWQIQVAGFPGSKFADDPELAEMSRDEALASASVALLTRRYRYSPVDTARFVTEVAPELRADGIEVEIVGELPDYRAAEVVPEIGFGAERSDDNDWLGLSITVEVDGVAVPLHQVLTALSNGATHMLLPDGAYFVLDTPELQHLAELVAEARALGELDSGRVRRDTHNATLWDELLELGTVDDDLTKWREQLRRLAAATPPAPCPVPTGLRADLRDYQRAGLDWLNFLWENRIGGVLADDMGLGKTLQSLALIAKVIEEEPQARILVVAPTSVISNWAVEAERFVPGLRIATVTETSGRAKIAFADRIAGAQLVVTSYALMRIGIDEFASASWTAVFFDEAQFVKNHASKAHQCARRLDAEVKIAITGTPLENNLMELWSLMALTVPGLFPSAKTFTSYFRKPIESGTEPGRLALLRRRIRPIMLRRTKHQVATDLPAKQEQVLSISLNAKHDKLYQTRLTRERQSVLGLLDDFDGNRFQIFRSLTMLRQLSLHAGLVDEKHTDIDSAKIEFLVEQIPELIAEGHSALIFSQFTGFLKLLESELAGAEIDYSYLDGSMTARRRSAAVKRFTSGSSKVFLISLKAGGFGLNLTEADYCFVCDPWWNPAAEAQAVDRAHRIGQTRPVTVYRLVSANTIEEKVVALQERKRDLFNAVVDDGDMFGAAIDADDIRELLGGSPGV
ncbi:SNF2-related protein [Gordonia terrae]|uniref:DEAD/DEAH box helicase n=1 Tax=Gordonia hongkongensis TaxID=1701090 RepID=UPI0022B3F05F|nr:SNF2-related protein [Gordonia terrae]